MLKLGFLASHAGSNMQAVVAACRAGTLVAEPRAAVSNNSRSGALAKARAGGIAASHINEKTPPGAVDAGSGSGTPASTTSNWLTWFPPGAS